MSGTTKISAVLVVVSHSVVDQNETVKERYDIYVLLMGIESTERLHL
jgi:hypothetical protein